MEIMDSVLKNDERAVFALRSLYGRYGYSQYKMSKFEEYELYVRNKDFLISDSVITFTDATGKLMALKPDVTLSIIKNGTDQPGAVQKVWYNENVYRAPRGDREFREIMQVGLECIGDVDEYCLYEVLMLAAESLWTISPESVLDISHLGIISAVLDDCCVPAELRSDVLRCVGEKNVHELTQLCHAGDVAPEKTEILRQLAVLHGAPGVVLPHLREMLPEGPAREQLEAFRRVLDQFEESPLLPLLHVDFSVVSDLKYYNGIVFSGFIRGIPGSVLSGGQYDRLMHKMGRSAGAVGFAVYLDRLERLGESERRFDVDTVLLYGPEEDTAAVRRAVESLGQGADGVMALRTVPEKLKCRRLARLRDGEVEILEDHA